MPAVSRLGYPNQGRSGALNGSSDRPEKRVPLGELREALGRLQFVAGPLEHLRPFLGPLYAWAGGGPKFALPELPVMLILIMKFLALELREARTTNCRTDGKQLGELFRLDAKADNETVAIGGWLSSGGRRAKDAPWFSVRLTRTTAPWAYAKGESFRVIASLELLGVLVGLMVLMPVETTPPPEMGAAISLSCGTDNQGNAYLLDKMLTTKFPLGVLLMELSHQMRRRRAVLRAHWLPRLQNEEADQLTNENFMNFSPENRVPVELDKLDFAYLPRLLGEGEAYMEDLDRQREANKRAREAGNVGVEKKRGKLGRGGAGRLRDREPWL